ncbi:hypothetical protein NKH37_11230 [Mesorhizobium sp. M1217]|uniref:hypothetical protein n=1 Tax=Mesorhizobium sp. M1217 TaxID=2957070 RepID=UPI0033377BA5
MAIQVRIEQWRSLRDDRSVLRQPVAPAIHIDGDTVEPAQLAEWHGGHVVLVTALEGDAFVEIGMHANASEFDPASKGHLVREGETARWFIFAGNIMIKEYKRG